MSTFGSSAYGSDSYGGGGGSDAQTFFYDQEPLVVGMQSRTVNYLGSAPLYNVHLHMSLGIANPPIRQARVYTAGDEDETPQLQVTLGEAFDTDSIVGAAPFITVEVELDPPDPLSTGGMLITGREVV